MATLIDIYGSFTEQPRRKSRYTAGEIAALVGLAQWERGHSALAEVEIGSGTIYCRAGAGEPVNRKATMMAAFSGRPFTVYGKALFLPPEEQPEKTCEP